MKDFTKEEKRFIAGTYGREPLLLVEGLGTRVKDNEGNSYIDCFSGIAVNNVGHCHPEVVKAVREQVGKLIHTSNIYYTEPQIKLAKQLYEISGGYNSFFCNSGAEANEAAIKLVRKHTGKSDIISTINSFHGRTITTLSATGQEKYKKGFEPLCKEFKHVPYGDSQAIEKAITENTAAVLIEPIQGEGGVIVPHENYLKEVGKLCRDYDILLVLDEVQTGFGRTGEMFAWQGMGVEPDIFTVAKALGGGMPIGAMLAREEVMSSFKLGDHASTFGGNPVTCAAALAGINVLLNEDLLRHTKKVGAYFMTRLKELKEKHPVITEVRGKGLLIGVELTTECQKLVERGRKAGFLFNCIQENVLRVAPPLIITKKEIDEIVNVLDNILSDAE